MSLLARSALDSRSAVANKLRHLILQVEHAERAQAEPVGARAHCLMAKIVCVATSQKQNGNVTQRLPSAHACEQLQTLGF